MKKRKCWQRYASPSSKRKYREYKKHLAMRRRVKKALQENPETTEATTVFIPNTDKDYYISSEWQVQRERILLRDGFRCTECGGRTNLQVHHKEYLGGSKEDKDCITLCVECHAKKHPKNAMKMLGRYEPIVSRDR